ncbi:MAG TPA: class I SAM-dependent methyltransferase [Ktedonobacteraceae bacterium]
MSKIEDTGALQREKQQAAAWDRLTGLRQHLYGAATWQMLAVADLQPGDQVLDIAAGTGDQSRQAARLVGPQGSVLATDISKEMLKVAARRAEQEGLSNITTRAMNAEQLDLPENRYDAVISRFGLMLIPNLQQALAEIRRVLKPGGRLAALVWSKPERNPLLTLGGAILAKWRTTEEGEEQQFDLFSLADAALFASMLTEAGFPEVQMQVITLTFHFPSFEVLTAWWGSPWRQALAKLDSESGQRLLKEARQAVRQFEEPQGIIAPAEVVLGVGTKEERAPLKQEKEMDL